jgi:hypothetical protein
MNGERRIERFGWREMDGEGYMDGERSMERSGWRKLDGEIDIER